jgi:hypothetical protein
MIREGRCRGTNKEVIHGDFVRRRHVALIVLAFYTIKGTVSWDFWTPVFVIKHLSLGLWFTPSNSFGKNSQFAKIFEFQIADDIAESWLSGVNGTAESCLRGVIDTAKSKLCGVIDTAESIKINFCIWSSAMTQRCHWRRWVSKDTAESTKTPLSQF